MTAGIASAWCTRPGARKNRRPTATARRSKLSRRNLTTTIRSLPTSSLTSLLNSTRLCPAQTAEYYATFDEGSPTPALSNHAPKSLQLASICLASVMDWMPDQDLDFSGLWLRRVEGEGNEASLAQKGDRVPKLHDVSMLGKKKGTE